MSLVMTKAAFGVSDQAGLERTCIDTKVHGLAMKLGKCKLKVMLMTDCVQSDLSLRI